jgi:hypothetical protein
VIKPGIAEPKEIPAAYGVMPATDATLVVARPAPRQAMRLTLPVWMAFARAHAEQPVDTDCQGELGDEPGSPHSQPVRAHAPHGRQLHRHRRPVAVTPWSAGGISMCRGNDGANHEHAVAVQLKPWRTSDGRGVSLKWDPDQSKKPCKSLTRKASQGFGGASGI